MRHASTGQTHGARMAESSKAGRGSVRNMKPGNVGQCANFRGFVQLAAFSNPHGWIGNRHNQLKFVIRQRLSEKGVIHIFCAGTVDGDKNPARSDLHEPDLHQHFGGDAVWCCFPDYGAQG